jgi:predicted DNA-binding protein (MmcQ/YjbR family)
MDSKSLQEHANAWRWSCPSPNTAGRLARSLTCLKWAENFHDRRGRARAAARQPEVRPEKSLLNQQIYRGIEPGYHLNKKHWISLYGTDDMTPELVTDLINDSWNLVVDKLPKKDQKWIRPV